MASWMSASVVMILLWFCEAVFFYPFVKATLLDLLLRVNNLRPRCCHCADVFLDDMSHGKGKVVCSNIQGCS